MNSCTFKACIVHVFIGSASVAAPAIAQTELDREPVPPTEVPVETEATTAAPNFASEPSQPTDVTPAIATQPTTQSTVPVGSSAAQDTTTEDGTPNAAMAAADAETNAIVAEFKEDASLPVRVYGFIDFNYRHAFMGKDSPWFLTINRNPSFFIGNFNVYLDAQLAQNWRSLAEVRYTYLPAGAVVADYENETQTRNAGQYEDYTDFAGFGRTTAVGGIILERAQLEYRANDYLTVTAGQWLTPYGIWVVNHGSPVNIGVFRPLVIRSQLIPERQVGIMATGLMPLNDDFDVSYALAISNGRTELVAFDDLDKNKAITVRAALNYHGFGDLTLGATVYRGKDTGGTTSLYSTDDGGATKSRFNVEYQFDELTYATDLRFTKGSLHVQTEWLIHEKSYTEAGRPRNAGVGFEPNRQDWGGYGLVGYRTPWLGMMPFAKVERTPQPSLQTASIANEMVIYTFGINLRPLPYVVFKAEYDYGYFLDKDAKAFYKSRPQGLNAQVAWAF